jgi:hypothetical protein
VRTTARLAGVALLTAIVLPFGWAVASADTATKLPAYVGGWYWREQQSGTTPVGGVPIPSVNTTASGVSNVSNLAVAWLGDAEKRPDKMALLAWDPYTAGIDTGASISKFVFTVTLAKDEKQVNLAHAKDVLVACQPLKGWGEASGDDLDQAPPYDCANAVKPTVDEAKGTFTYDVTSFAGEWVDGDNFGVALVPSSQVTQPFQLVFQPYAAALADVEFTPAAAEPTVEPTVDVPLPSVAPPPAPPVDSGTGTGTGNLGGGSGFVPGGAPVVQPNPSPATAPAAPAPVVNRPVTPVAAQSPFNLKSAMPAGIWIVGALVLGLLVLTSLVLGDPRVPLASGRSNGLSRVLQARRRGLHSGPGLRPRAV